MAFTTDICLKPPSIGIPLVVWKIILIHSTWLFSFMPLIVWQSLASEFAPPPSCGLVSWFKNHCFQYYGWYHCHIRAYCFWYPQANSKDPYTVVIHFGASGLSAGFCRACDHICHCWWCQSRRGTAQELLFFCCYNFYSHILLKLLSFWSHCGTFAQFKSYPRALSVKQTQKPPPVIWSFEK